MEQEKRWNGGENEVFWGHVSVFFISSLNLQLHSSCFHIFYWWNFRENTKNPPTFPKIIWWRSTTASKILKGSKQSRWSSQVTYQAPQRQAAAVCPALLSWSRYREGSETSSRADSEGIMRAQGGERMFSTPKTLIVFERNYGIFWCAIGSWDEGLFGWESGFYIWLLILSRTSKWKHRIVNHSKLY